MAPFLGCPRKTLAHVQDSHEWLTAALFLTAITVGTTAKHTKRSAQCTVAFLQRDVVIKQPKRMRVTDKQRDSREHIVR